MITTEAECRINGVHVTEVKIESSVEAEQVAMSAVYATLEALADKPGGKPRLAYTHGRCTATPNNWSNKTLDMLRDLLKSMERDLLSRHFKNAGLEGVDDRTKGLAASGREDADQV